MLLEKYRFDKFSFNFIMNIEDAKIFLSVLGQALSGKAAGFVIETKVTKALKSRMLRIELCEEDSACLRLKGDDIKLCLDKDQIEYAMQQIEFYIDNGYFRLAEFTTLDADTPVNYADLLFYAAAPGSLGVQRSQNMEINSDDWAKCEGDTGKTFLKELISELSESHPLSGKVKSVVWRRFSQDDVLCELKDGRYAVVHLTYSKTNIAGAPFYTEFTNAGEAVKFIIGQ